MNKTEALSAQNNFRKMRLCFQTQQEEKHKGKCTTVHSSE